jgi:uncharacterized SAM-binding protein YcdF (DUF218 family)
MTAVTRRHGRRVLWIISSLILLLVAALLFAKPLLCVQHGPSHGDVIIVLGGESVLRAERVVELFKAGASQNIIVSGDGHKGDIETCLIRNGVPSSVITLEPKSRNTKENAEFACDILKSNGVKHAIIVTSWFHSRRSLACFQHFGPSIQFSSLPSLKYEPFQVETVHVLKEYLKIVWYVFRYQIPPWT